MKVVSKNKKPAPVELGVTSIRYESMPQIAPPSFVHKLRFPEDLTELGTQNISELLGKYTLLWTYVNQDMARLRVKALKLSQKETNRINSKLREMPALNQIERWKRDALLAEDESIEFIRTEQTRTSMELEQCGMYLANYDKYINALSRELTRKTHEVSLHRG